MDQTWLYALVVSTILPLFFFFIFFYKQYNLLLVLLSKRRHKILPPSPLSIPIIGHLHLFKNPIAHRTFQQLSSKYGSIFSLYLGQYSLLVISSPAAVEECFTKKDIILANRPRILVGKYLHYDSTTMGAASYGPLWLSLRRLTNQELFSTTRMDSFASIRVEEVRSFVKVLFGKSKEDFAKFRMSSKFSGLSLNILSRMLIGKRYFFFGDEIDGSSHQEAKKFLELTKEIFELTGVMNLVDCFPFLRWINFQNSERRMIEARKKMDVILDDLIEECRRRSKKGCETNDEKTAMIFKLLNLQELEPANYPDQIIKGIIMIMLIAGTDTSAVTMEWALSLLLNHPNVLQKAREEIDNYKGNENELLNETDLPNLPYIQCIINETLRLFPAAPLLVGHVPSEDITISGYHIDKGKTCLINAWAIHRDPNVWEDPLKFRPERFEGLKIEEYRFIWIPFGLGRRSCPGASLANKVIGLCLATLIQCFDWRTIDDEEVDLSEGIGLTMPKAKPLEAMCRARPSMIRVLSKM